jgi:ribonuclease P protein component
VKREQRLRTRADFGHVREAAPRAWPHRLLVVYMAPNDLDTSRVGITVSGRVGKAVARNRVRRRLREALTAMFPRLLAGQDILVIARPRSAQATWPDLNQALENVLARAGLLTDPAGAAG